MARTARGAMAYFRRHFLSACHAKPRRFRRTEGLLINPLVAIGTLRNPLKMIREVRANKILMAGLVIILLTLIANAKSPPRAKSLRRENTVNAIFGQVWDPYNQPVANIYVELMNELNSTLARQQTTQSGNFRFIGLSAGSFKIKVVALGTDYIEQIQDVQIINLTQGSSDSQFVEFHLRFDPRRVNFGSGGLAEEIYVQDGIPQEAEKHYQKGESLRSDKKSDQAIVEFQQALAIAPNYYNALAALGRELVERGEYQKSLEYLVKAIDINQRSFSGYYALAYACYQLKEIKEGVEAARAATVLKPASVNAQILYGTLLRIFGNYDLAEQALQKAKTLGQNKVAQVNWQLALLYNRMKRNKEAVIELETFLKNQPDAPNKKEVLDLIEKLKSSTSS
jgi:tetratricopeptide (TPR) repeat protein